MNFTTRSQINVNQLHPVDYLVVNNQADRPY